MLRRLDVPTTARGARAAGVVAYGLLALLASARADLPAPAPGYQVTDEGPFTLEAIVDVSAPTAGRLRRVWGDASARVEAALGVGVPGRPHCILAATDAEFARRLALLGVAPGELPGEPLAVAFAGPDIVVVRERGVAEGTPAGLEPTLGHELAHLALGRVERVRGARLPRWLNEGLAEWASGHRPTRDEELTLGGWARFDELPGLDALAERFPPHGTGRAYLIALGFVAWADRQEGGGGVLRLVAALGAGASVDDALRAATGRDLAAAEPAWREALIADYSLAEALARSVTVWTIVGVLALLAVARHVLVRRRRLRELALADEAPCEPPPPGATVEPPERGGVDVAE